MGLYGRNVITEYIALALNLGLGFLLLPFNVHHLGQSTYGLWVLATSVTSYFSILDLGYGSAQVKFVAQYRALSDANAINEVASTIFFLFLGIAVPAYVVAAGVAWQLDSVFQLGPEQAATGRAVLLIVSINVALTFPFSVYGGIVNGFQRYYVNHLIDIATSLCVAVANVMVLMAGGGVVTLVAITTAVRLLALIAYRQSAHKAFPLLDIRWRYVRKMRLHEVTAFSIFLLVIDVASKINMTSDTMVIGAFVSTAAVAVWSVASRLTDTARLMTSVLTSFLFPTIVHHATRNKIERLRMVMVEGTRVSLATVIPLLVAICALCRPLVAAWVGPRFAGAVPVVYVLAAVVAIRTGSFTGRAILKGAGQHKFLARWSVISAVLNLVLSIVFVRWFGLVGAATGSLVSAVVITAGVMFPAACRRVDLRLGELVRRAVWPPLWPSFVPAILLVLVRPYVSGHIFLILMAGGAAMVVHIATFVMLALAPLDRALYVQQLRNLLGRTRLSLSTS